MQSARVKMRERLPTRRRSETFGVEVRTSTSVLHYTATVGYFPDGRIGELFLSNHKSNSGADVNARDARSRSRSPCSTAPTSRTSARHSAAKQTAALQGR